MTVQDNASSTIEQTQDGKYNAGYGEQLFENGSTITQQQAGTYNTSPCQPVDWRR